MSQNRYPPKSPMDDFKFVNVSDYITIMDTRRTVRCLFANRHRPENKPYFTNRRRAIHGLISNYKQVIKSLEGKEAHFIAGSGRF